MELIDISARPEDHVAIVCVEPARETSVSTKTMVERARRIAGAISEHLPGAEIVPMLMGKSPMQVETILACLHEARYFAPLNRRLRIQQIRHVLTRSAARVLVLDAALLHNLRADLLGDDVVRDSRLLVVIDRQTHPAHLSSVVSLRDCLDLKVVNIDDPETPKSSLKRRYGRGGACLFTSGSTGDAKGVLIDEDDLLARARAEVRAFGLGSDDVLLSILPFSFDVGLNQLMSSLLVGARLVLLDSWLPADVSAAILRHRVNGVSGVPALWRDLLQSGICAHVAPQARYWRYLTVSGGSLPNSQFQALRAALPGIGVFKTYGQTEAFRTTILRPEEADAHGSSVGRPFEGVELFVVRDDGTLADIGEPGEVVHAGLGVMRGYLGGGHEGKLRLNPFRDAGKPDDLAVYTGDYGFLDEGGYLHLQGRRDFMLKIEGNRVYPGEVVEALLALPSVQQAEAIGVKAQDETTHLFAFVIASQAFDPAIARQRLQRSLPSYMVPRLIVPLDSYPLTTSGKVDFVALQEIGRSHLVGK